MGTLFVDGSELKIAVAELGLVPNDFSRLIAVTPRAVAMWFAGERTVPGPVEAYLRVFKLLSANLRQIEFNRLKQGGTMMRDGMYGITFQSPTVGGGAGMGVLVFDNGRVYGSDTEGVKYDGEYLYREDAGLADVKLKVTFPPNVKSVFNLSNPYEWAFDVTATVNPKQDSGKIPVQTSIGTPINAQFTYLRSLPDAG